MAHAFTRSQTCDIIATITDMYHNPLFTSREVILIAPGDIIKVVEVAVRKLCAHPRLHVEAGYIGSIIDNYFPKYDYCYKHYNDFYITETRFKYMTFVATPSLVCFNSHFCIDGDKTFIFIKNGCELYNLSLYKGYYLWNIDAIYATLKIRMGYYLVAGKGNKYIVDEGWYCKVCGRPLYCRMISINVVTPNGDGYSCVYCRKGTQEIYLLGNATPKKYVDFLRCVSEFGIQQTINNDGIHMWISGEYDIIDDMDEVEYVCNFGRKLVVVDMTADLSAQLQDGFKFSIV